MLDNLKRSMNVYKEPEGLSLNNLDDSVQTSKYYD